MEIAGRVDKIDLQTKNFPRTTLADKEDLPRVLSIIKRQLVLLAYCKFLDKLNAGGVRHPCTPIAEGQITEKILYI